MENKKNKGGRPSKLNSLNLEEVKKLARLGLTDKQIAGVIGVAESNFYEWKKKSGEFRETLNEGKKFADETVERSLYERATGYSCPEDKVFCNEGLVTVVPTVKHYPPDVTACIFWLKNRRPDQWRDKTESELSSKDGKPLVVIDAGKNPYAQG